MMKSFKLFWKDYAELWRHSNQWMKKHWKGWIVLTLVLTAIQMIPYYIEYKNDEKRTASYPDWILNDDGMTYTIEK